MKNIWYGVMLCLLYPFSLSAQSNHPDFDGSGTVDFPDFLLFVNAYNTTQTQFDLTGDSTVDFGDFLIFAQSYGQTISQPPATAACHHEVGNGLEIISGPAGPQGQDRDNPFRSLPIFPDSPDALIVGTERNGFIKTLDGGQTWTRHRAGLRHFNTGYPEIWDIALNPSNPTTMYAATLDSPGPFDPEYPSSIAGVYKSTDSGDTWFRTNCNLANSRITAIQISAADTSSILIGVEGGTASFDQLKGQFFGGGIYHSTNSGLDWNRLVLSDNDETNGYWRILYRNGQFITFGFNLQDTSRNIGFWAIGDPPQPFW